VESLDFSNVELAKSEAKDYHVLLSNLFNVNDTMSNIKALLVDQVLNSTLADFVIPYNTIFVNNNVVFNDLFV